MSSHPRLSIVIPHLNEPDSLQRCLAALNAQRNPNIPFEIIVVDNGSRIPPRAACAAVPGVRLERESIPGPGPARNRGAAVANADLLAFIDAFAPAGLDELGVAFKQVQPPASPPSESHAGWKIPASSAIV
mgnify:CR=1 FL=1